MVTTSEAIEKLEGANDCIAYAGETSGVLDIGQAEMLNEATRRIGQVISELKAFNLPDDIGETVHDEFDDFIEN